MEQERTTEAQTTEEYLNPETSGAGETPTSNDVGKQTLTKQGIREGETPGEFKTTPELDDSLAEAGVSVSSPEEGADTGNVQLTVEGITEQVESEPQDDEA